MYRQDFVVRGTPLKVNDEAVMVMLEEETTLGSNGGIKKAYEEKFKELKELEGRIAHIIVSMKTISKAGNLCARDKWVTRLEIANNKRDWFDALYMLKTDLEGKGQTKIALYPPCSDPRGLTTRKIAECIFRQSGIKCLIYIKAAKEDKLTERTEKKEHTDAIIINQPGKSYSELLKIVKDKIPKNSDEARHIRTIREAKRGGLVMVIDKGENGRNGRKVKDILTLEKEEGLTVVEQTGKQPRVTIKGIDGAATKEEVEEAIREHLGTSGNFRIVNMRPFFAGNQAATVAMDEEDAKRLTKQNNIKIGLSRCRVTEFINVIRCTRCWKFGHNRYSCKEESDDSDKCRKCGGVGHLANKCDKKEYCLSCKCEGHTTGTNQCPQFLAALNRIRGRTRQKKRANTQSKKHL